MVYISFPREDLNSHADLTAWRLRMNKRESDWKALKDFLASQPRLRDDIHPLPKCWFSELPQGDPFARDVEHFRPKNRAAPLRLDQLEDLKKQLGIELRQVNTEGAYTWLEFDYRNYRLVTAITNRGGAKHVYFPIVQGSDRLDTNGLPWETKEYPYFLDPTDAHDASLLSVLPDGRIQPRTPITDLTNADFADLPNSWHSSGFNYIRAAVTIQLYRLNESVFVAGRKEVYDSINESMSQLLLCFRLEPKNLSIDLQNKIIKSLKNAALPSAPFSLAARCALEAYVPPIEIDESSRRAIALIPPQILRWIDAKIAGLTCSWENP